MQEDDRRIFIEEAIEKAIREGTPLYARILYGQNFENYCDNFRESKRIEGTYVADACLETWRNNIKNDFKHLTHEAISAHIFDWESPIARRARAKQKRFLDSTKDD